MQKYNYILLIAAIGLLTIPFLVIPVQAEEVYIAFFNPASPTTQTYVAALHPNTGTVRSGVAQAFLVTNEGYVEAVTVKLQKYGSPTGHISMKLCGAYYTTSWYTNETDLLETSSSVFETADISTSYTSYSFTFNGTTLLEADTHYGIIIYASEASYMDSSNRINVGGYSSGYSDGKLQHYYSSAWTLTSGSAYFTVIGDTELPDPSATPTPAPSATAAPSVPPELTTIWTTVGSLIGLLVPLLVVVLPAFFGYKFAGAWGFLAGVNIGAILAYTILGSAVFPLWGIVVILILDALLLFGKVGFHS